MSDWLKALLGIEETEIPPEATTAFEFANLPRGTAALVALLVLGALVAGVFWIYRREGNAPRRAKLTLAVLRSLVLLAVFLVVAEPVLSIARVETVEKSTILLLDESLSMTARDRYQDPVARARLVNALGVEPSQRRRFELVNAALRATDFAARLARQNELRVFRFADGAVAHATFPRGAAQAVLPPLDPEDSANRRRAARGTNMAGAIRDVVDQLGSDRVASVVLIGDGRATLGPPAGDVALFLRNKDLRLHTVVVGEGEAPRNLRVVALAGPDRVFRNDPVAFEARVSGRGFGGATVEFERRDAEGGETWERVAQEMVIFPPDEDAVTLDFTDRPPEVGTVEYRVRIDIQPDEATVADNEKSQVVRVVDEKAKVLLVAGAPTFEYYAVKNVLLRDTTIQAACFLQSADPGFPQDGNDISLREIPGTQEALYDFDVVILLDPDGSRLPPGWRALLRRFVGEYGGGLFFVAGNKFTLPLLRSGTGDDDLADVLPVVLDLDRADQPGVGIGYGAYFGAHWRMVPGPGALTHPATRFHTDPAQARDLIWDRLPPFYWFFPVLKGKPGALVLARHEDARERVEPYGPRPILAAHRYGAGNVLFLASDETYRWRSVAETVFDRFWVQGTRFLLEGRHAGERRRFRIYVDREVADLGDAVQITVEALTEKYEPLMADVVRVLARGPEGFAETVDLLPVAGKDGHFGGSFAPPAVGEYGIVQDEGGTAQPGAGFSVVLPDREMGDVRADAALLRQIAVGVAVGLDELERLTDPALIPPASERVVTQGRPVPLWDTWTTIVVVLLLLCAEWILRKRFRMV